MITMLLSDFTRDIIDLIIGVDHEVYRGFLSFPWFARTLTPNMIVDWAITCGVNVTIAVDWYYRTNLGDVLIDCGTYIIWTLNNRVHRGGGLPAIEGTRDDGAYCKYWMFEDKYYCKNDKHSYEESDEYCIQKLWNIDDGVNHRYNNPANIAWDCSGNLIHVVYRQHDMMHNYSGPALVCNGEDIYCVNDIQMTREEYFEALGLNILL